MHSAGLELTKLTYTRLEDNLIRHRGDRITYYMIPGTWYWGTRFNIPSEQISLTALVSIPLLSDVGHHIRFSIGFTRRDKPF